MDVIVGAARAVFVFMIVTRRVLMPWVRRMVVLMLMGVIVPFVAVLVLF